MAGQPLDAFDSALRTVILQDAWARAPEEIKAQVAAAVGAAMLEEIKQDRGFLMRDLVRQEIGKVVATEAGRYLAQASVAEDLRSRVLAEAGARVSAEVRIVVDRSVRLAVDDICARIRAAAPPGM